MTYAGKVIAAVVGLAVTGGLVYAASSSSSSKAPPAPAPPPTPTLPTQTWTLQQGYRYEIRLWINGGAAPATGLSYAQVLSAFPGSTRTTTNFTPPPGTTLNVWELYAANGGTAGAPGFVGYGIDLFMPTGTMTAAELASPYTGTETSLTVIATSQSVSVTVTELGKSPTYGVAPSPAASSWKLATAGTMITPGARVALSVSAADWATVANSLGLAVNLASWQQLFSLPQVQSVLQAAGLLTYGPGDALPSDWPSGDVNASTGYHALFTYTGTAPLAAGATPFPSAQMWTQLPSAALYYNPQPQGGSQVPVGLYI